MLTGDRLGDLRAAGTVHVAGAWRGQLGARVGDDLDSGAVVQRVRLVGAGLVEPRADEFGQPAGLVRGEVVEFGPVLRRVVQLPGVVAEVTPAAERAVRGDCLPAVVPDAARSEHRVELRVLGGGNGGGVEAVAHAHALDRVLGAALHRVGEFDAQAVQERRHQVDGVVVLVPGFAAGRDAVRPGDDAGVAGAAVERVALPHLERGVEGHRPAVRVVVVGLGAAQFVQHGQVLGQVVRDAVGDLVLVD